MKNFVSIYLYEKYYCTCTKYDTRTVPSVKAWLSPHSIGLLIAHGEISNFLLFCNVNLERIFHYLPNLREN